MESRDDTIAAVATPAGTGGIGIIKMSGPRSAEITARIFKPRNAVLPLKSHRLYYGEIVDPDTKQTHDEVLVSFMAKPRSYTREDVIEINCHGGYLVLQQILSLLVTAGARLAEPGEFTRRAFINGRIDLAQAEAVVALIEAKSCASLKQAAQQLQGRLSLHIKGIQDELLSMLSALEASIEFPEEDLELLSPSELRAQTDHLISQLTDLANTYSEARFLREGASTIIAGRPNVGKSSLFNMLLNEERAIVTPLPGTTRDCIEEMLVIKGIPLKLADTAGLRDAADIIEEEGVRITNQKLDRADLTVLVIDGSIGLDKCDEELLNRFRGTKAIVVCNKTDLPAKVSPDMLKRHFPERQIVATSALHRTGIEELKDAITSALLSNGTCLTSSTVITTVRHASALEKTLESLEHAKQGLHNHIPPEFIAADLQFAVHHLGQITGSSSSEEVLDQIFSRFCVGK